MQTPEEEKERIKKELQQLKNRKNIFLNRKIAEERRIRAHRLIEHGTMLEQIKDNFLIFTYNKPKLS